MIPQYSSALCIYKHRIIFAANLLFVLIYFTATNIPQLRAKLKIITVIIFHKLLSQNRVSFCQQENSRSGAPHQIILFFKEMVYEAAWCEKHRNNEPWGLAHR